ncbi:MAG: CRP/FNR family cyclic AMP-dependent transcriptional regulator [Gammaproteobacteria bacterium]|jgi:CRP/FNR family cyclic AMP-dependent transcriptional regulator
MSIKQAEIGLVFFNFNYLWVNKSMSKQSVEGYLSTQLFFTGIDAGFLKFLVNSSSELKIQKGDVLFRQGELADKFYFLRNGRMSIQIPAIMGPSLEIQELGGNQVLGWSWLIPPYSWNFQARAMEDTNLIEFDGSKILAHCEQDPKFGYELFKIFAALMSERLDAARQKMMDQWNPAGFA